MLYAGAETDGVAGIGGNVGEADKNITIEGGTVVATGGALAFTTIAIPQL